MVRFLVVLIGTLMLAEASVSAPLDVHPVSGSASETTSIPFALRKSYRQQGNLVANASFEKGTVSSEGVLRIDGWQVIGSGVEWVEVSSEPDGVDRGRRALRISRTEAGELDAAAGVLSDYIEVIPGNYDFLYDVKIRDLVGARPRLGQRLHDAVVVKVLFFDRNRRPVEPGMINPVDGTEIDASDKGYSFSAFWRIHDFPWGTVRGRTYNYPFSEGDLPDRTRYVRLFFGLKGKGTLWLDNIVYRYSKWNFTTLERYQPYFHQPPSPADRLLPTPKELRMMPPVVYGSNGAGSGRLPMVVLPEAPAAAERMAAGLLQEHLNRRIAAFGLASNGDSTAVRSPGRSTEVTDLIQSDLVFSIGKTRLYEVFQPDVSTLPGHDQGYVIDTLKVGGCQVVFLLGETPVASYYAAATAVQLLDSNRPVFHSAAVVDYPDFSERSFLLAHWDTNAALQRDIDRIPFLTTLKFNRVYVGDDRRNQHWWNPDKRFENGVAQVAQMFNGSGVMHVAVMLNPYKQFPFMTAVDEIDAAVLNIWNHGSPKSFAMLQQVYAPVLEAGADTVVLLADDFMPHTGNNPYRYTLYSEADRRRFVNLQHAHAHVLNQLKQWIDAAYPGTQLAFCPPWYCNEFVDRSEGRAEAYFEDLVARIPEDIAILWTGPTIRSLSVDMADLTRFRELIGRDPRFWDNTLYARGLEANRYGGYTTYYPGKVRMCNLFEPFDTYKPSDFHRFNHGAGMYVNGALSGEIYQIKYATVADYLWNSSVYDPERSLWKVLCRDYGVPVARQLVIFNDAYYTLYGTCRRMELEGVDAAHIRKGARQLKHLENQLQQLIDRMDANHPLIEELSRYCEKQRQRFAKLSAAGK